MMLVAKIFLAIFASLLVLGATNSNISTGEFIYMNNPERLKTTGILHKKKYNQNTNVRYFFHYVNGTKSNQKFEIKSNNIVNNYKFGCDINFRPEIAGSKSVEKYMYSEPSSAKINYTRIVKPEETISGIFQGTIIKDDEIVFCFGSESKVIAFDKIQSNFDHSVNLDAEVDKISKFRLGDPIKNKISGQYGNDINLIINPKQSGILKVSFSPRGGEGKLVFENRGKIYKTEMKSPYKQYDVMYVFVEKGKLEKFQFIPIGGFNYPMELSFSLHTEILKEAMV